MKDGKNDTRTREDIIEEFSPKVVELRTRGSTYEEIMKEANIGRNLVWEILKANGVIGKSGRKPKSELGIGTPVPGNSAPTPSASKVTLKLPNLTKGYKKYVGFDSLFTRAQLNTLKVMVGQGDYEAVKAYARDNFKILIGPSFWSTHGGAPNIITSSNNPVAKKEKADPRIAWGKKRLTKGTIKDILALRKQGKTYSKISKKVGFSVATICKTILKQKAKERKLTRATTRIITAEKPASAVKEANSLSTDQKRTIRMLRGQCFSIPRIAEVVSMPPSIVSEFIQQFKIQPDPEKYRATIAPSSQFTNRAVINKMGRPKQTALTLKTAGIEIVDRISAGLEPSPTEIARTFIRAAEQLKEDSVLQKTFKNGTEANSVRGVLYTELDLKRFVIRQVKNTIQVFLA